jgi:hypothetical protein
MEGALSSAARFTPAEPPGDSPVRETETIVLGALLLLLERREDDQGDVTIDTDLYDELQLDSLEVAEFSAVLEAELGSDPYSEGVVPRTVRGVADFYDQ